jgi:hypothetical protein
MDPGRLNGKIPLPPLAAGKTTDATKSKDRSFFNKERYRSIIDRGTPSVQQGVPGHQHCKSWQEIPWMLLW